MLKIKPSNTKLEELHECFEMTKEDLENRKARLFPIGNTSDERATVDIFLATLSAVKEYREKLFNTININKLNARNSQIHVYTEILDGNKSNRPDGLIVITSGKKIPIIEWAGFIEAKVGDNILDNEQIQRYTEFADEVGIKDIITISNYLVTDPLRSPVKSKRRSFNFYHWSWTYLKVFALKLIREDKIIDNDHIYILKEFRRYCDTHKNLKSFKNMGKNWKENVTIIQSSSQGQKIHKEILEQLADVLMQEEKDVSLQLTDNTQHSVMLLYKDNRFTEIQDMIQNNKTISSNYILDNDKNKKFSIEIDFQRYEIRCKTEVIIENGKAQSQTSTLLKKFEKTSSLDHILINAKYPRKKMDSSTRVSVADLFQQKDTKQIYSTVMKEKGDEIKSFEIMTKDTLTQKQFLGNQNFIIKLEDLAQRFVEQVIVKIYIMIN